MLVDLIKLHEKTYGYTLRTGKKGKYKYWYKDYTSEKLYEGKKPEPKLIENFEQQLEPPPPEMITKNPWANYNSSNAQMIYCEKTNVPYNKLGIISREELELYESYLLSVAYKRIFDSLKNFPEYYLPIDSNKIKILHRLIFEDLYPWAGNYRNINISKEGFPFPPADQVKPEMKRLDKDIFNKIKYTDTANINELAELLALISSEITIVHPFREGNGRVVRVILDIISIAFNHCPANWDELSSHEDKDTHLKCMFHGYKKDYKPLTEFYLKLLLSANS